MTAPERPEAFSRSEMMIVAAARELAGQHVCFVGVGLPNIAVNLAKRTVAPDLEPHELAAWRGFLEAHAHLVRELDAELTAEHDLSLSAYDVLVQLAHTPSRRLRMSSR